MSKVAKFMIESHDMNKVKNPTKISMVLLKFELFFLKTKLNVNGGGAFNNVLYWIQTLK